MRWEGKKRPMRISLDINRDAAVAAVNHRWEVFLFSLCERVANGLLNIKVCVTKISFTPSAAVCRYNQITLQGANKIITFSNNS